MCGWRVESGPSRGVAMVFRRVIKADAEGGASQELLLSLAVSALADNLALENHVVDHFAEQLDQVSIASKY